jgi:RecA-superfamily ATPases implicated in signal transduction
MYNMGDVLPDVSFDLGSNVLVSGPPLTGKRRIALEVLAAGSTKGEGVIIVTTKDDAEKMLSQYGEIVGGGEIPVGIVDCVTQQRGVESVDDPRVKYASSPVDMTGIGINLSEYLEEFYEARGIERNRVLLHSVSTLLMYSNLETVFRFLHVFTGRIQSANALGVHVIDSTAHDEQTINTLKQLYDGLLMVEEGEDGPVVRQQGIVGQ